jgi:hypothetical protein
MDEDVTCKNDPNASAAAVVTPGPLGKLPIEWLVQVLQWQPTKKLFQIMRTNREWECGSRYVLKWRKTLKISLCEDESDPDYVTTQESQAKFVIQSIIKSMKSVTTIRGYCAEKDGMIQLVTAFADQLEDLSDISMPKSSTLVSVRFPKLQKMYCVTFNAATGSTHFPKLKELETFSIKNGSHANAVMPSLQSLKYRHAYEDDFSEIRAFLRKNAKTLIKLDVDGDDSPGEDRSLVHFDDENIVFQKLEEIRINDFAFAPKCPAIKSVITPSQESISIAEIPVANMTVLKTWPIFDDDGPLFARIGQMTNLKHLRIIVGDLKDQDLMTMFPNLTQLETVFIGVTSKFTGDHLMEWSRTIYENNKNLTSFIIRTDPNGNFDLE